jgi:hypothetical protein
MKRDHTRPDVPYTFDRPRQLFSPRTGLTRQQASSNPLEVFEAQRWPSQTKRVDVRHKIALTQAGGYELLICPYRVE